MRGQTFEPGPQRCRVKNGQGRQLLRCFRKLCFPSLSLCHNVFWKWQRGGGGQNLAQLLNVAHLTKGFDHRPRQPRLIAPSLLEKGRDLLPRAKAFKSDAAAIAALGQLRMDRTGKPIEIVTRQPRRLVVTKHFARIERQSHAAQRGAV